MHCTSVNNNHCGDFSAASNVIVVQFKILTYTYIIFTKIIWSVFKVFCACTWDMNLLVFLEGLLWPCRQRIVTWRLLLVVTTKGWYWSSQNVWKASLNSSWLSKISELQCSSCYPLLHIGTPKVRMILLPVK